MYSCNNKTALWSTRAGIHVLCRTSWCRGVARHQDAVVLREYEVPGLVALRVRERVQAQVRAGAVPEGQKRHAVLVRVEPVQPVDEDLLALAVRRDQARRQTRGRDVLVAHQRIRVGTGLQVVAECAQPARVDVGRDVVTPEVERLLEAPVADAALGAERLATGVLLAVDGDGLVRRNLDGGRGGRRRLDRGDDCAARPGVGCGRGVLVSAGREGQHHAERCCRCEHEPFHDNLPGCLEGLT
jgi:hypothetical protein